MDEKWHKKYKKCTVCKKTDQPHKSKGRCKSCYAKDYYKKTRKKQIANAKKYREENIERIRRYDRDRSKKRNKKMKVAFIAKDVILRRPTKLTKNMWNGIGDWHRDFFSCIECQMTVYKHHAHGICKRCYDRLKEQAKEGDEHEKKLEYKRVWNKMNKEEQKKYRRNRRLEADRFLSIAEEERNENPRLNNLLNQIDEDEMQS